MNIAILQARTSSRRLPQKVLMPILGKPMLAHQIERIGRSQGIDRLLLATSTEATDDAVAAVAAAAGVECFRGSLDDVLDRYYQAAKLFDPAHVIRLTGDCPLTDWTVIDQILAFAVAGGYDYASNTLKPTYPDGLDVEVATFAALETAWREAREPLYREHVMPFLTGQPDRFRLGSFEAEDDLSGLRWTVDEPADFEFVKYIYEALFPVDPAFGTRDILELLCRNPEVSEINKMHMRNEDYVRAMQKLEQAKIS